MACRSNLSLFRDFLFPSGDAGTLREPETETEQEKTGTDIGMTYRQIYEELEQEGKIL